MKQNAQMGQVQEQVSHLDVQVREYYKVLSYLNTTEVYLIQLANKHLSNIMIS